MPNRRVVIGLCTLNGVREEKIMFALLLVVEIYIIITIIIKSKNATSGYNPSRPDHLRNQYIM